MTPPEAAFGRPPHWGAPPAAGQSPFRGGRWVCGGQTKTRAPAGLGTNRSLALG